MLVGLSAVSKAQQGRVGINTTTPSATLDVVANTTDNARPDALLVPRMSRAQLEAKNGAYADGSAGTPSAQNGALVFVNGLGGLGTGKTVNVTATGFYYYDGTDGNNVWKPVGGGGSATTQRYENIRGNVTTVNAGSYTVAATDHVVVTQFNAGVAITLPTLTNTPADIGRIIKVINNNTAPSGLTFSGPLPTGANLAANQGRGIEFIWTGTLWTIPQK
ncbi:hypothetical protein [Chryseobacterium phocaeense]|uniref:hypothetical protein n=1 Tax=Chryseobacterium phocaeense TaxID=1816690 RepID=UPI00111A2B34|nr:hypothetical protein [Chryseobacterium phocaeense]